ncbi:hypothetical protein [Burkholderia sp. Bp9140]|uniref:hypothetical protein n=1 Tax=Burkholderia sp. Bp9140 TaxID=2184572 RepID=UPI00162675B6|nr:hypothetical protein [Burkholderia sp. Bp9140]
MRGFFIALRKSRGDDVVQRGCGRRDAHPVLRAARVDGRIVIVPATALHRRASRTS